jgi:SOS-response transcriptional repressor LexA
MNIDYKFKHLQPSSEIFISNLQYLMRQNKISEAELSRLTNIPQPTLHKILSGKTTDPRISTLKTLADYFNITLDLLYQKDLMYMPQICSQSISIPIISWKDCINKDLLSENFSLDCTQWILLEAEYSNCLYGLISKPSMEPFFPKGTILIIDTKLSPEDGDLVIVHYKNTTEATLRELSIDGPHTLLLPLNQTIQADMLNNTIKIIGVVIQSRFSY